MTRDRNEKVSTKSLLVVKQATPPTTCLHGGGVGPLFPLPFFAYLLVVGAYVKSGNFP